MQNPKILKRSIRQFPYTIVGFSIFWFICVFLVYGFDEASVRMNIRWSARFAIICFCLAFGASAFRFYYKNRISDWLIHNRRILGISFALIHLVHLLFLVVLHKYFDLVFTVRPMSELALGGLAYAFLVTMLLTSFAPFSKLLSTKHWIWLHTIGGYWILIVFSNSIFSRIMAGNFEYLPFVVLLVCTWAFRLAVLIRKRTNAYVATN